MRRLPRSPVSYADADQARRRRLPVKWLAAMLITTAVALLAPGVTYVTADRSSTTAATSTAAATTAATSAATATSATTVAATTAAATTTRATSKVGCRGVTEALLPANGFVTNPSRAQGGHLWWQRSADGSVCVGTVIMWARYNTAAAKTWRVIVYSARHPGGLTVASRTFTLERGWYWRGFRVHRSFRDLSAVCVTATESFGVSCVRFSAPAG